MIRDFTEGNKGNEEKMIRDFTEGNKGNEER